MFVKDPMDLGTITGQVNQLSYFSTGTGTGTVTCAPLLPVPRRRAPWNTIPWTHIISLHHSRLDLHIWLCVCVWMCGLADHALFARKVRLVWANCQVRRYLLYLAPI